MAVWKGWPTNLQFVLRFLQKGIYLRWQSWGIIMECIIILERLMKIEAWFLEVKGVCLRGSGNCHISFEWGWNFLLLLLFCLFLFLFFFIIMVLCFLLIMRQLAEYTQLTKKLRNYPKARKTHVHCRYFVFFSPFYPCPKFLYVSLSCLKFLIYMIQ